MSNLIPPIFATNDRARSEALDRASRETFAIVCFAAPAIALPISFVVAVGFRLIGAGESTLTLTIGVYSLLLLCTVATFHAHQTTRILRSSVRLVWYGYAIVIWIVGCALLLTFDTSLSLYKFHI